MVLTAIRLHTEDMSLDEAAKLFSEKAFLERSPARQEALRCARDPGCLSGALGKMLVYELRQDYRKAKGPDYSLEKFHDDFLRHGGMPIKLIRRILLAPDS